jgi:hypothetical protein
MIGILAIEAQTTSSPVVHIYIGAANDFGVLRQGALNLCDQDGRRFLLRLLHLSPIDFIFHEILQRFSTQVLGQLAPREINPVAATDGGKAFDRRRSANLRSYRRPLPAAGEKKKTGAKEKAKDKKVRSSGQIRSSPGTCLQLPSNFGAGKGPS